MLLFKDTEEVFVADSGDKQNYSSFSTRQSPAGWLVPLLVWQAAPLAAAIIAGPVGTEQAYVLLTRNTEAIYVTDTNDKQDYSCFLTYYELQAGWSHCQH